MIAVRTATHVHAGDVEPFWIGIPKFEPRHAIAMENGILDYTTGVLHPLTPEFFCLSALPFKFNSEAPLPETWLKVMGEWLPNDVEAQQVIQEYMGYCLTKDSRHHKYLYLFGPPRCGKGTITRMIGHLVGARNVFAPTLAVLAEQFGLQDAIGKHVMLVPDAQDARHAKVAVERLASIIGEDSLTIARKNIAYWTGRLSLHPIISSNLVLSFPDRGGAILARTLGVEFKKSFVGNEDLELEDKLIAELPGILNWSLEGLARLLERGAFVQPKSGLGFLDKLAKSTNNIGAFFEYNLIPDSEGWVSIEVAFKMYLDWCKDCNIQDRAKLSSFCDAMYSLPQGKFRRSKLSRTVNGTKLRIPAIKGVYPQSTQLPKYVGNSFAFGRGYSKDDEDET